MKADYIAMKDVFMCFYTVFSLNMTYVSGNM